MSRSVKERVLSVVVAGDDIKKAAIKGTDSAPTAPKTKHVESELFQMPAFLLFLLFYFYFDSLDACVSSTHLLQPCI